MEQLVSIRGAVTADNTIDGIKNAAVRLIDKIYLKNGLIDTDVVSICITVTKDITAFSPARAIREAGHNVALFSALEPDIDGVDVERCIRVMVTARSGVSVRNVYLNGARALRKDLTATYAVALDGPSGAGKSTVAKIVAERLKITYLDTGALYRALGLKCLKENITTTNAQAVEDCIKDCDVTIKYMDGAQRVLLDGADVSSDIRTPAVSMAASNVSAIPYVREKLLGLQRGIASESSVILDGRDIGTVVLPNAEFKYFLTASADVRARRRFDELTAKGQSVVYEDIYKDVVARDRNDSTRKIAPLKQAYDAVLIDSDNMTAEQVAQYIIDSVTEDLQ